MHSEGPGQVFKVPFQHLLQNSDSGPFDSKLDIRTMNYTTKHNNKDKNRILNFICGISIKINGPIYFPWDS